jgi:hypothetical protein
MSGKSPSFQSATNLPRGTLLSRFRQIQQTHNCIENIRMYDDYGVKQNVVLRYLVLRSGHRCGVSIWKCGLCSRFQMLERFVRATC